MDCFLRSRCSLRARWQLGRRHHPRRLEEPGGRLADDGQLRARLGRRLQLPHHLGRGRLNLLHRGLLLAARRRRRRLLGAHEVVHLGDGRRVVRVGRKVRGV
eukprot:224606-Prymnesium_polylepis.1